MKKLIILTTLSCVIAFSTLTARAEPNATAESTFKSLMAATIANNYDQFVAQCDEAMKGALSKEMLEGVSNQIGPRAKQGYDAQYFGEMKKHGYDVYLWRLRFKDGGDDILATLSIKNGKAGGFYLK